jgi:hypothetical protein
LLDSSSGPKGREFVNHPAFRLAGWNRSGDQAIAERLASQPTQSKLIDTLTRNTANIEALRSRLTQGIERHVLAAGGRRIGRATIDIESFPIEVHGQQHGAKYTGFYRETVYHRFVASLSVAGDYGANREGSVRQTSVKPRCLMRVQKSCSRSQNVFQDIR